MHEVSGLFLTSSCKLDRYFSFAQHFALPIAAVHSSIITFYSFSIGYGNYFQSSQDLIFLQFLHYPHFFWTFKPFLYKIIFYQQVGVQWKYFILYYNLLLSFLLFFLLQHVQISLLKLNVQMCIIQKRHLVVIYQDHNWNHRDLLFATKKKMTITNKLSLL